MIALKVAYIANILVAGWIGITSLFYPERARTSVFENAYPNSEFVKLVGALWLAIAVLSLLGLWKPIQFSPVLVLQLIYKGAWLVVVALPAVQAAQAYPKGMASFFLVWVLALPFIIPWRSMFQ